MIFELIVMGVPGIRLHYMRAGLFLLSCLLYLAEVFYYDMISTDKIGVDLENDCFYDSDADRYLNGTTFSLSCTIKQ